MCILLHFKHHVEMLRTQNIQTSYRKNSTAERFIVSDLKTYSS